MKHIRTIISLIIVVGILFASTPRAEAIGFEAEVVYESVFVIYSGGALGSGFAVGENCIVTNAHVIENTRQITVESYGGTEYEASVFGMDEYEDIAVLVVEGAEFPYLTAADLSEMKTGDDIYAIGAPKGMAYTLTKGSVSAKERSIGRHSYIQIDAPINEGNSGGPLLSDAGQVLGMNTLKMLDSEGIGLAIPITRISGYLGELGIGMNTDGSVRDSVALPEQTAPAEERNEAEIESGAEEESPVDDDNSHEDEGLPAVCIFAFALAGISLAGNIVLAVLLVYQKKKNIKLQYDPRERTDFEIDIL